ncbi:hypothetical protein B5M43_002980 [Microbacterium sp. MEC084]|uniref:hypothetical protein n=1 Tax=Microbacterium sp. MEC084 TaxID=1963027 RepID=UPI00106F5C5E|nr:hypothetical protein [Microbacterium sp. MEC084]MCD1267811.1 hypothetical protein [Microbacterium sp. MEC084]
MFYLVTEGNRELWIAYESMVGQIYVYVPDTGRYHRNRGVARDYYGERELSYAPLSAADARALMRDARIGRLDAIRKRAQLDQYRADAHALESDEVLRSMESMEEEGGNVGDR